MRPLARILLLALLCVFSAQCKQRSNSKISGAEDRPHFAPIKEFLTGKMDSEGHVIERGMGFEDDNLVELLTFISDTLETIYNRIQDTEDQLKNSNLDDATKTKLQKRLNRSYNQYRIAWGMIQIAASNTVLAYNIRQGKKEIDPKHFEPSPQFFDTGIMQPKDFEDQVVIKKYILDKFQEFFIGTLKFVALKEDPAQTIGEQVDAFAWLDNTKTDIFDSAWEFFNNKDVGATFQYPNQIQDAQEFLKMANTFLGEKAVVNFNLLTPSDENWASLNKLIFDGAKGDNDQKLRKVFRDSLGTFLLGYNPFTMDSYFFMRGALMVSFKHILDHHPEFTLQQATDFAALPGGQKPIADMVRRISNSLYQTYQEEVATGPSLADPKQDAKEKNAEYQTYHADLLKDVFGKDLTHWIYRGDPKTDIRARANILRPGSKDGDYQYESRLRSGLARPEMAAMQDGDLWLDKGTGMGSDLIGVATTSGKKRGAVNNGSVDMPSFSRLFSEKIYYKFAYFMGSIENKLDIVPGSWKGKKSIGVGIDYTGASHTGLVISYGHSAYPQLDRVDLEDAFPNLLRQAWRREGCGHAHARKCMFFRIRKNWARSVLETYPEEGQRIANKISAAFNAMNVIPDGERIEFHNQFTNQFSMANYDLCRKAASAVFVSKDNTSEQDMMRARDSRRLVHEYCQQIFAYRGYVRYGQMIYNNPNRGSWNDDQLIKEMGKVVAEVARAIRVEEGEYAGLGTGFDNRFDSLSKGELYCSEYADLTYRLAWGKEVYPKAKFRDILKKLETNVTELQAKQISGGFLKVPWSENDDVFAPQEVFVSNEGRQIWESIGEMRRGFYGITDE